MVLLNRIFLSQWVDHFSGGTPTVSANDRETMRSYLETYHCFPGTDVTMADLIEYLPKVFEKIRDNVEGYVDQKDGFVLETQ